MKKIILIILFSTGLAAQAQQQKAPIQGYWVIESNVKTPRNQILKFYDSGQQLLYQETYNRKVLKCGKKCIRKMMDSALVYVLTCDKSTLPTFANVTRHKHQPN